MRFIHLSKWLKSWLRDEVGYRKNAAGKRTDLFLHPFKNAPSLRCAVSWVCTMARRALDGYTGWLQCNWSHQNASVKKISVVIMWQGNDDGKSWDNLEAFAGMSSAVLATRIQEGSSPANVCSGHLAEWSRTKRPMCKMKQTLSTAISGCFYISKVKVRALGHWAWDYPCCAVVSTVPCHPKPIPCFFSAAWPPIQRISLGLFCC